MASRQAVESVHTGWMLALIGLAWPAGVALQLQGRQGRAQGRYGVRFDMLHPSCSDFTPDTRPNAVSCVLMVQGESGIALLVGDIEREQEMRLLREQPAALRGDLLIAPQLGSWTSSIAAFFDVVQPLVAVFQAGHRNRYAHPAPDVVSRYRERGIAVVSSPSCGAWTWRSDKTQPARPFDRGGGPQRPRRPCGPRPLPARRVAALLSVA